jgi:DNA-binding NtrC family response regulator
MTGEQVRLLLVDDDRPFLVALSRMLGKTFQVTVTDSPVEGLELARTEEFDCVVSDLQMPEMNGIELLSRVAEAAPSTGRIMMSKFSDSELIIQAINRGAIMAFLIKPFTYEDVSEAIYRSIARARAQRKAGKVLALVEDRALEAQLSSQLAANGIEARICRTPSDVHGRLARGGWDLVLVDLEIPRSLEVLHAIHVAYPDTWPVVLANDQSQRLSEELLRLGARDFVTKPLHEPEVILRINRLLASRTSEALDAPLEEPVGDGEIVGESGVMTSLRQLVKTVASVDCPVLIRGETGTGKDLVASSLHRSGRHSDGPFRAVNCAALTETLFESEVFGHERGAFTGAVQQKRGLCELAARGCLLLDEIGELSTGTQAKLLRFIETGEFYRVGGTEVLHSDARILAATNRDLGQMITDGTFRADLYHRLSTIEIFVPALREHPEDIPQLVSHFLKRLARQHGRPSISIDHDALEELMEHTWPGNVRELSSVLERGLLLSPDGRIRRGMVRHEKGEAEQRRRFQIDTSLPLREAVNEVIREAERDYLVQLLSICQGNVSQVAKRSGVDRRNLYRKLESLDIDPGRFREIREVERIE